MEAEVDVEPDLALLTWLLVLVPPALLFACVTALIAALMQDVAPWLDVALWLFLGPLSLAGGGLLVHGAVYVFGGSRATLLSDSMALITAAAAIGFIVLSS